MRSSVAIILFSLFVLSLTEVYANAEELYVKRYIALSAQIVPEYLKEEAIYENVEFPIYAGYATFYPDGTIEFTKKADFPITDLVSIFDEIKTLLSG